jgi:hypothetical protein
MSDRVCSSCGTVNTGAKVYCSGCGGILEKMTPTEGDAPIPATIAVAKRRSVRIEADRPPSPTLFSRLKGVVKYLLSVAFGVVLVLTVMAPKQHAPEVQNISGARDVVKRMIAASRYSPAVLSQQLINSCLAQQGSFTWQSPVSLVPMPTWESSRVELSSGKITMFAVISFLGRPIHFSETFRAEGLSGSWNLIPESATIGLLDLPKSLIPGVTSFLRSGVTPLDTELKALSSAQSLVIRPGLIEFTIR